MEKHEKHRKNKGINIGGNIGGFVVLVGAFAVAGSIAAFVVKRRRRRDDNKDLPCKKEVKGSQGLRFIPQNPSSTFHQNPCLTDGSTGMVLEETQIDSTELLSTESLILEENSASMINDENENFASDDQEILLTDDPKQEMTITSCEDCCGVEELPLPILDSDSLNEVEDKIKNDSEENLSLLEGIEIERQDEEVDAESNMEEETKSVNLVEDDEELERVEGEEEEDEEGYSNEEYVIEEEAVGDESSTSETTVAMHLVDKEEEEEEEEEDSSEAYRAMDEESESSEGTGSTSAETNAETIWPAESIEVLSRELKNTIINKQCPGEKIVKEDGSTKTEELGGSIVALPLEVKNTSVNLQSSESKEKIVEEEDQNNKTEEFRDFNNSKSNILNNDTDNHENSKDPMSLKKKEMLEFVEVNNQTAARRKIWVCAMLLVAFWLLLLFTHYSVSFMDLDPLMFS